MGRCSNIFVLTLRVRQLGLSGGNTTNRWSCRCDAGDPSGPEIAFDKAFTPSDSLRYRCDASASYQPTQVEIAVDSASTLHPTAAVYATPAPPSGPRRRERRPRLRCIRCRCLMRRRVHQACAGELESRICVCAYPTRIARRKGIKSMALNIFLLRCAEGNPLRKRFFFRMPLNRMTGRKIGPYTSDITLQSR